MLVFSGTAECKYSSTGNWGSKTVANGANQIQYITFPILTAPDVRTLFDEEHQLLMFFVYVLAFFPLFALGLLPVV